jgi:transposase, IS30 family
VPGRRLAFEERTEIRRRLSAGESLRSIGSALGRPASTISREIARNGGSRQRYHPWHAQRRWKQTRCRPKVFRLERHPKLARQIARRLARKWSPDQIAQRLRVEHPDDPRWWVSAETIYQSLYVQGRGGLAKELTAELRRARTKRKSRPAVDGRGRIPDMMLIAERPAEAADRAVPGHWEGDLIIGADGKSALIVLVERTTRYTMLVPLPVDHTATTVRDALTRLIRELPDQLRRSLTWDQGKEMSQHVAFSIAADIPVYFCDPSSPWQRGTNENTNGLLRQYWPKGTSFQLLTKREANRVAIELNGRPRKTLGYHTPAEAYADLVAMTA